MFSIDDIGFIQNHLQDNTPQLWLKYGREKGNLIQQIEARQKAKTKLPAWYANAQLVFPSPLSVEQSSSEVTARYKAAIMALNTCSILDATGGMGIDTYYFSGVAKQVVYTEKNIDILQTAEYNFRQLNTKNIQCLLADSTVFLAQTKEVFDWIYIDPSRRDNFQKKVFKLSDCEPNVVQQFKLYQQKSKQILIKVSPLLDISQILQEIPSVNTIHIVAVENDCKELLLEISHKKKIATTIKTINFRGEKPPQLFDFMWEQETLTTASYSLPLRYIYLPNVAVLKSGGFKKVATEYGLHKIALHSHIYTADNLIPHFAGRIFELEAITKIDSKAIAPFVPDKKANLAIRNFPATVEQLRKTLKISDGGDVYLLATTLMNGEKRMLVCRN